MKGYRAFRPTGLATIIPGATVSPSGVQPSGQNQQPEPVSYMVSNPSLQDAWMSYEVSAAAAQSAAIIPTAGNPRKVVFVPAKSVQILSFPAMSYFSAITASGTADIVVQQGEGQ